MQTNHEIKHDMFCVRYIFVLLEIATGLKVIQKVCLNDYKTDYHYGLIQRSATMVVVCLVVVLNICKLCVDNKQ